MPPADTARAGRTRWGPAIAAALLTAGLLAPQGAAAAPAVAAATESPSRPNILLVITDDQPTSMFTRTTMPRVFADVVDQGVRFDRAYVSSALCCPSRAQIFTGLYEHHTGVDSNIVDLQHPTIVGAADDLGYHTILAGKYLNGHPCEAPLPEFDTWACQGPLDMKDPQVFVEDEWRTEPGYTVDVLADHLRAAITATPADEPFFAVYAPKSPHAPMDDDRFPDLPVDPPRPPSYDEETRWGTKPYMSYRGPITPSEEQHNDQRYREMSRATLGLDGAIGDIFDELGSRLDDTLVVVLSDNGFLFGEHRRVGKKSHFEDSVRVPFAVRYPPMHPVDEPVVSDALVGNVDIASSFADLMGVEWVGDGVSFLPLVRGDAAAVRDSFLVSRCQGNSAAPDRQVCSSDLEFSAGEGRFEQFEALPFAGVVTHDWKLVDLSTGERELYDLATDPHELDNLAGTPEVAVQEAVLAAELQRLRAEPPETDTMIVTGPPAVGADRIVRFTYSARARDATFHCRLSVAGAETLGEWAACGAMTEIVGPLADGDYLFEVAGTTAAGEDPTPASRSFTITTTGPVATLTSVPPPRTADPALHVDFTTEDGVDGAECRLIPLTGDPGDVPWSACDPATGFDATATDGTWRVEVRGRLGETATSPPAAALVEVDTTAPILDLAIPPSKTLPGPDVTIALRPLEPLGAPPQCTLDLAPADCAGEVAIAAGLADGVHNLAVTAVDTLGNEAVTTARFWTDTVPPVLTVDGGPPPTAQERPVFTFHSDESGRFHCRLDGGPVFTCEAADPVPGFGSEPGGHSLAVQAVDFADLTSEWQTFTWTIDLDPPALTVAGIPTGVVRTQDLAIELVSEDDASLSCALDSGAAGPCADPLVVTSLRPGRHRVVASATDVAGNVSSPVEASFLVDTTGTPTYLLSASEGAPAAHPSGPPALAAAGTPAVYVTESDDPASAELVVADRPAGDTRVVATDAVPGSRPAVSADGSVVAYVTSGAATGDPPQVVVVRGEEPAAMASVDLLGGPGDGASGEPSLSDDGTTLAFASAAGDLWPGDLDGVGDVFALVDGSLRLLSSSDDPAGSPAVSGDGRLVAFVEGGVLRLVDLDSATTEDLTDGSAAAAAPDLDETGRWVTWESEGAVWLLDRDSDERRVVSAAGSQPALSADGRIVAFTGSNGGAGPSQVWFYDRFGDLTRPASIDTAGDLGDGPSASPAVSGDGNVVVFQTSSASLVGTTVTQVAAAEWVPVPPPGPPEAVEATAGDGTVSVVWQPPLAGGPVEHYTVRVEPAGITVDIDAAAPATAASVGGLPNGVEQTVHVDAVGIAGSATASAAAPVTPMSAARVVDAAALEGDSGTTTRRVTVALSAPSAAPATFGWALVPGDATGKDIVLGTGSVTIAAGAMKATVRVRVRGDLAQEVDEHAELRLVSAAGATIADAVGVVTVLDNDPDPTASVQSVSIAEGDTGLAPVVVRVTLSAPSYLPITVTLRSFSGTATAGSDFVGGRVNVRIDPGRLGATKRFDIIGDTVDEPDEAFSVAISATTAAVAGASGTVTILDDDPPPNHPWCFVLALVDHPGGVR